MSKNRHELYNLQPMEEAIAKIRKEEKEEAKRAVEYTKTRADEKIAALELHRQAIINLDGANYTPKVPYYSAGEYATIDLGLFNHTKADNKRLAEELRKIQVVLGCRVKNDGYQEDDAEQKTVVWTWKPVDFPGISIKFQRRLRKSDKCKYVKEKRTSWNLVCAR